MITRDKITTNFVQIPKNLITDIRLCSGAITLFIYLLSQMPTWDVDTADIQTKLNIADKKTVAKYFKMLLKAGWITRKRRLSKDHKYTGGYDYHLRIVESEPNHQKTLLRKKPSLGKNGAYSNNIIKSNNIKKSNIILSTKKAYGGKNGDMETIQLPEEVCVEHSVSNCKKCKVTADRIRKEMQLKYGTIKE